MPEKLTFSKMTWEILEEKYGILPTLGRSLFEGCAPVEPTAVLVENLRRGRRSRLANERAKAYRLVDPVLAELEMLRAGKISSIPEMDLEIKDVEGLCGNPDFIISASPTYKVVPIIAIVEAKKDDMDAGLPQCAAELYASYLLNKGRPGRLYGCVTFGTDWKFLCFHGDSRKVDVDDDIYFISEPAKLLGVLCHIVDVSLAALEGRE
jgi:hypothetical protein